MPATRSTACCRAAAVAARRSRCCGARRLRLRLRGQGRRPRPKVAAEGKKIDGLDHVKIGYFAQPHARHRRWSASRKGCSRRNWAARRSSHSVFNAGPAEIEALNARLHRHRLDRPLPRDQRLHQVRRQEPADHRAVRPPAVCRSWSTRRRSSPWTTSRARRSPPRSWATPRTWRSSTGSAEKGWKVDAAERQGRCLRRPHGQQGDPGRLQVRAPSTAPGCPSRPRPSWSPRAARCSWTRPTLWPDKKFVITNIIVSQKFLKEHPEVVEAVLRGSVKTNAWINANPDEAKAAANDAAAGADSGKALPADVLDPAWKSHPGHRRPAGRHPRARRPTTRSRRAC